MKMFKTTASVVVVIVIVTPLLCNFGLVKVNTIDQETVTQVLSDLRQGKTELEEEHDVPVSRINNDTRTRTKNKSSIRGAEKHVSSTQFVKDSNTMKDGENKTSVDDSSTDTPLTTKTSRCVPPEDDPIWTNKKLFPMLWFGHERIPDLQKFANYTHSHITERIQEYRNSIKALPPSDPKEYAGKWNEVYGNQIGVLSFYCLLFPSDTETFAFAKTFLHRMVSQPNWLVTNAPMDEVPVSHSLNGVAVALDFLWPRLSPKERSRTARKIEKETNFMQDMMSKRWWGYSFLQNHVWSNTVSIYMGGLVVGQLESRNPMSSVAAKRAHKALDSNMAILDRIHDGSLDEGVGYTSYSTRGITQFVSLAMRHNELGVVIHGKEWLQQHVYYNYATVFNRYSSTVGIADSNFQWFYSPTSQLRFLDTYVLRSGCGNWLADKFGEAITASSHNLACTLHTEYIWFDPELKETDCPLANAVESGSSDMLHVFNDWGVATYGAGQNGADQTFLSLKASHLHGRAVSDIVRRGANDLSWKHFHPGHEHPDQGSFTFYPKNVPIVTEDLYAPAKRTSTQNTLLFRTLEAPSDKRSEGLFHGQLGSSAKWLQRPENGSIDLSAEILATDHHHESGMVLMTAEFPNWYSKALKFKSLSRTLLLLDSETLLVIDQVVRGKGSAVTHVSAMFNNFFTPFALGDRNEMNLDAPAAYIGDFNVHWDASNGNSSLSVTVGKHEGGREGPVNFLNLTTSLADAKCDSEECSDWLAYIFSPKVKEFSLRLISTQQDNIATMRFESQATSRSSNRSFHITMASNHIDFVQRSRLVGSGARVIVRDSNLQHPVLLGSPNATRQCGPDPIVASESGVYRCNPPINAQLLTDQVFENQQVEDRISPIYSKKGKVPFLYCDIPKCGVAKWRRVVRLVEGVKAYKDGNVHDPKKNGLQYLWQLPSNETDAVVNDPSVKSFVIVRNPYVRALSGWIDKALFANTTNMKPVLYDGKNLLPDDFPTFVRKLVQTPLDQVNEHWLPMVSFCGVANGMSFDHVLKLEEIGDWGEAIAEEIGVTDKIREGWGDSFFPRDDPDDAHTHDSFAKVRLYYTEEAVELIKEFYTSDFEVFGYDTRSPLDW